MQLFYWKFRNKVSLLLCLLFAVQIYQANSQTSQLWWVNSNGSGTTSTFSNVQNNGSNYREVYANSAIGNVWGLTKANNGKIYGISRSGGQYDNGVLFEIDPATSAYTAKHHFDTSRGINSLGGGSIGTLVADQYLNPAAGKLYGANLSGGANGFGAFYEFSTVSGTITKLFDMTGEKTIQSFVQARNGKFYGLSLRTNSYGIFEYDISTNTYTLKLPIPVSGDAPIPIGFTQHSNGKLYTFEMFGAGSIYEYSIELNTLTKRANLSDIGATIDYASSGSITLTEALNGKLYGVASRGSNSGVLYEFDPGSGALSQKKIFDYSITGGRPAGPLTLFSNGKLYAVNNAGGQNAVSTEDGGTIYQYDPATNQFEVVKHLPAVPNGGHSPRGNVVETPTPLSTLPVISIGDVTVNENAGTALLDVCLSKPATQQVTVTCRLSHGSATAGQDHSFTSVLLTIGPGISCGRISVPIIDDILKEPTEDIVIVVENVINATIGDAYGAINIIDNDSIIVAPSLNVTNFTISEGSSPALVNVCLSSVSSKDVSFYLTTAAYTAGSGSDYTSIHQQFTIPAGQTCISVPITIINDNIFEPTESFTTNLSAITNAVAGDIQGWVNIIDDDNPPCLEGVICIANTCPFTTVNLNNAYSIANLPTGTAVSWHTGTPASNANKLTAAEAASITRIPGSYNYYAAINTGGTNCYSNTVLVVVNIKRCIVEESTPNSIASVSDNIIKNLTIAPNPFVSNIQTTVQVQKDERVVFTVMDIFGRTIKSKTVQLSVGKNQVTVDGLGKLPAGSYLLRVAIGTGVETHKIVKQ